MQCLWRKMRVITLTSPGKAKARRRGVSEWKSLSVWRKLTTSHGEQLRQKKKTPAESLEREHRCVDFSTVLRIGWMGPRSCEFKGISEGRSTNVTFFPTAPINGPQLLSHSTVNTFKLGNSEFDDYGCDRYFRFRRRYISFYRSSRSEIIFIRVKCAHTIALSYDLRLCCSGISGFNTQLSLTYLQRQWVPGKVANLLTSAHNALMTSLATEDLLLIISLWSTTPRHSNDTVGENSHQTLHMQISRVD